MTDPEVFQYIGASVLNATNAFVQPAAARLIEAIQLLILTGVTLYIVLTGYAISTGAIESPFWTFVKLCMKIIIIAFFALTADGYFNYVVEAIYGLEQGLTTVMSGAPDGSNIYQVLDRALAKGFELVQLCQVRGDAAGFTAFGSMIGWYLSCITIALATVLVTVLGAGVIIVAKFSLAIMLGLGPLFIALLMFPATAKFFDSWFGQVLNYVITIVIMSVIMSFAVGAFEQYIDAADFNGSDINPLIASLQVGALTAVLMWIIMQSGGMASGLAGGVSAAAMSIRQLAMPLSAATAAANHIVNAQSTRRDMQSGMMVTAGRSNHIAAGNSILNPAYRQHVMSNLGKNWGSKKGGDVKGS